jgi:autotransporter-associated beta strand protein
MNPCTPPLPPASVAAFAVATFTLLALSSPLAAQTTYTWDGGGTNTGWGNASNWVDDVVPAFNTDAILVFDTNVGTADTTFTGAQRQIRGTTFGANLTGGADNVFDIQTRTSLNSTATNAGANLLFNGGATNASIIVEESATGLRRVRLGAGNVGAISFQTETDLLHDASGVVLQFDANTTGAGALNKHGVGAVTFTRANSFNGLNLSGGTVVAWNTATALGSNSVTLGATGSSSNVSLFLGSTNTYTNAITVSSGSGTRLIGNTDVTNQFVGLGLGAITGNAVLSGGIDLAAGKDVTFAITNYAASTDRMTVRGPITGTGGLAKTGNGILLLTVSNSYSGTTDIQGGKFYLGSAGRLGSGTVTIASGANLDFGTGSGQTNIVANNVSGDGTIIQSTPSTDTRITGNITSTGGLNINNGTLRIGNGGTTGSYSGDATVASGAVLAFARTNAYIHTGKISGAGNVTKVNAGDVTLTASNDYSGVTSLFDGTLVAGDANALSTGDITFRSEGENTGTIRYTAASAGTDWAPRIVNSSGTVRLDTDGNNVNLAGVIDSSNTNGLAKSGAGTLTLGSANTYRGNTTVDAGTLQLAASGALTFVIRGSGVNNRLSGGGTALLEGQFVFDLDEASTDAGATWTIVDSSLGTTYGPGFMVNGFNGSGGLWTLATNGVTYQFEQSTGVLSIAGGTPGAYADWLTNYPSLTGTNALGTADPDGDGLLNDTEFAFGGNPTVGTPALMTARLVGANKVFNWTERTNGVTYVVQQSTSLTNGWTPAAGLVISNSADQTGVLLAPTYVRKEFVISATGKDFYRVQASVDAQ